MDADDSIELGPSAPALELPWRDPQGRLLYIDLRASAGAIQQALNAIPEAVQFPALRRFLLELNSAPSVWQTAKCDVWSEAVEAAENLYDAPFAHSCYVDLVLVHTASRDSLGLHQRIAREMARLLEANTTLEASAEIVVRRCYFHHVASIDRAPSSTALCSANRMAEESDAGYCLTQFLTGYGRSPAEAQEGWEQALDFAVACWLKVRTIE